MMDEPLSNLYVNLVSAEIDEIKTVVEAPESRIVRTIYGLPEDEVGPLLVLLEKDAVPNSDYVFRVQIDTDTRV